MTGPVSGTGAATASARLDAKALLAPIQGELERVDALYHQSLHSESPHVRKLVEHAALFRGKQLRPALVLLTGRACGRVTDSHVAVGAIIEMIHTATLLHDDVLDHATTRRNVPSANALHGNEIPILLGDFIYAEAFSLANRRSALPRSSWRRRRGGCAPGRSTRTHPRPLRPHDRGVPADHRGQDGGALRVERQARRALRGREPGQVAALSEYGRLIGIAFQIVDDCLDLAGDERRAGKSLGTDLASAR